MKRKGEEVRYQIKESCNCGAILEYEDTPTDSYFSHLGYVQKRFQEAHKNCRKDLKEKEKKDEKFYKTRI